MTATQVLDLAGDRPGAGPLRLRRRRARADRQVGRRRRPSAGATTRDHRAALRARRPRRQHLGRGPAPRPPGCGDVRARPPARRRHAPARRRQRRPPRPGRPLRGVRRPPAHLPAGAAVRDVRRRLDDRPRPGGARAHPQRGPTTRGRSRSSTASWPASRPGSATTSTRLRHADVRALLRHRLRGRPTRCQLPHRHPHGLHDGADALGAPPRGVPRRPRRRRLPARSRRRRRRRAGPAAADRRARPPLRGPPAAPRRDRVPRPRRWSSPTPAAASTPAPSEPPAVPLGELLDALDRTRRRARARRRAGPPPAPALRRGQPRPPAALVGALDRPFTFDRSALAGAPGRASPASRRHERWCPRPCPHPSRARRGDRSPTSTTSSPTPCAASCASGCASPRPTTPTRPRTPSRSPSTGWRSGTSATGSSRDVLSGADPQSAMLAEQLRGLLPPRGPRLGHAHRDRAAGAPARGGRGPPAHRARTHPRRRHRPR